MNRFAIFALGIIAALLLTGFTGEEAGGAVSGTIQVSVGAACGGIAVVLFNLHRHSARSEARHFEQEANLRRLTESVSQLEQRVHVLMSLLKGEIT